MMISTRGRYALRVMIELARQEGYVALKDVARRQDISEKYLEAIMKKLVGKGLVSGVRGKGGGYRLAKPAEECTVGEILRPLEGSLAPVSCVDGSDCCARSGCCVTMEVWRDIQEAVSGVVDHITLQDLADRQKQLNSVSEK